MLATDSESTVLGVRIADSMEGLAAPHPSEIGTLARSAAKWSLFLLVVRQGVAVLTTAILARFISPAEFGLVAMVTVFTAFLGLLDVGLGWSTVQAKDLNGRMVNSLFWFGLLWGLLLWAVCAGAGSLLAAFYAHEELIGICSILGAGLFVNSLAAQPAAILKRKMRQQMLSGIETVAMVGASLIAVGLAISGWGYWALVAQVMVWSVIRLATLIGFSGFRFQGPRIAWQDLSLLKFSAYMGACSWTTYFQLYLDNILVGRYCGAASLGFYTRAVYLKTLPTMYAVQSMNDVMIPALASVQRDPTRLGEIYRKALKTVAFIGCPAGAFLGVAAPEIVHVLYGPAWKAVVPLLAWLSIPATVLPIYNTAPWLFISTGKSREFFWLSLILTPVAVAAYSLAVTGGLLNIALARVALFTVPFPLATLYYAHRTTGIDFSQTYKAVTPILVSCIAAVVAAVMGGKAITLVVHSPVASLLTKAIVGGFTYLGVAKILMGQLPLVKRFA
jgi:O-antigen/teichoic acid export membrane protein